MLLFGMFLRALTRTPVDVAAEILALRQQLAIDQRTLPRPRLPRCNRLLWVCLSRRRVSGSFARPPSRAALLRAGLRRHRAVNLGLDRPDEFSGN